MPLMLRALVVTDTIAVASFAAWMLMLLLIVFPPVGVRGPLGWR